MTAATMTAAKWLPVMGFEGFYEVSNTGRVRRIRAGQGTRTGELRAALPGQRNKYMHVVLYRDGRKVTRTVHRLVAEAFLGPCPEGLEACHRNDDTADNRVENIRWDTHLANCADRTKNAGVRAVCRNKLHEMTEDNTKHTKAGRRCLACYRAREHRRGNYFPPIEGDESASEERD